MVLEAVLSIALGAAPAPPRIVYASDWSGSSQLYAVDPSRPSRTAQLTFGRPPVCVPANPCGYTRPLPSPDGRRVLFWDFVAQGPVRANLYLANADGRSRRRLATVERVFQPTAVWAPDSRRIAYTADDSIRTIRANGSGNRPVSAAVPRWFSWSADGRFLATLSRDGVLAIAGGRTLALGVDAAAWAPKGGRLAYLAGHLALIRADGRGGPRLIKLPDASSSTAQVAWSPAGRWIAFAAGDDAYLASATTGAYRPIAARIECCAPLTWSPTGGTLAVETRDRGLVLVDARTGATRMLGEHAVDVAWSPTGREIAYVVDTSGTVVYFRSDLRVATVGGAVRTVVAAATSYGGRICCVAWTRPPRGTSYRPAAPRSLAAVSGDELVAGAPVTRLAADGDRVAYVSCGHVFVWATSTGDVQQAEPQASLSPSCSSQTYYAGPVLGGLALADDRIAYLWAGGGNTLVWWLGGVMLPVRSPAFTLGTGMATNGLVLLPRQGSLVSWPTGSGGLLVYSDWTEVHNEPSPPGRRTTRQAIHRVGPEGCPCPEIAASPGPLVPYDVDAGRIVAGGDNATVVYDANGSELLVVPVSPLAAQLAGPDLVILRRAELQRYDAATGALRHRWPLPDVPSGAECDRLFCTRPPRLVLADASHGLVAYVLDGAVRLLRLADGADSPVAPGSSARFVDSGLVVADGPRLRLLTFDRLPLRAFG